MAANGSIMETSPQDVDSLESLTTEEFLRTVGRRVRQHRNRSRMSRKRLAELSGVSERYLAQLESGQGNMSIILLRRVSAAIELPLSILMSDTGLRASGSSAPGSTGQAQHPLGSAAIGKAHAAPASSSDRSAASALPTSIASTSQHRSDSDVDHPESSSPRQPAVERGNDPRRQPEFG